MTKDAHIGGEHLLEPACRKTLGIILALAQTQMLLSELVVVVTKLVHKNVQEHVCPCLSLRETAGDAVLLPIIRNAQPVENVLVRLELRHGKIRPKILGPRMKTNHPGLFSSEELVKSVVTFVVRSRQYDPFQSLRVPLPIRYNIYERPQIALADDMTESVAR